MMATADPEQLLTQLARRNWVILALLLLASLAWRNLDVTLGVLGGGLVAIVAYRWLERSLRGILAQPEQSSAKRFKFGYFVRLAAIGFLIYVLLTRLQVHPLALTVGLSVVVINILYATVRRLY